MSSIRIMAEELGNNMEWEMRWLPSYFYEDAEDEDKAGLPVPMLSERYPWVLQEYVCEVAFEEITIGLEPIVTPSSHMTFEQICLATKLTSAIKLYHLEKANKC